MLEKTFNQLLNDRNLNIVDMKAIELENGDIQDIITIMDDNKDIYEFTGLRFLDETYKVRKL